MAEKYAFFNSSSGDRTYNAADFAGYFGKFISNGIFSAVSTNLQLAASNGLSVQAMPGSAWINGYCYENTSELELALETANGVNPRIDRVVLRWSAVDRNIKLAIKTGAASSAPVAPALIRNSDVYELGLADIAVGRGVLSINAGNITDTRLNTALCGTVNSLIGAVYE